jgi:hypothetical protein
VIGIKEQCLGKPKEKKHLEYLEGDGRKIFIWSFMMGLEWICLTQDRKKRQTLVNTVMNLGIPYNVGNFLIS